MEYTETAVRRQIDDKHDARVILDVAGATESVEIFKSTNNTPIPKEEPMILFRGRDHLAIPMLEHYLHLCLADGCTDYQIEPLRSRIALFQQFALDYPDCMKQPGITLGR